MTVFCFPIMSRQDFPDVLLFLQRSGYEIEEEWFASHLDFRFPKIGSIALDGIQLELRQALEPWHVLGEETSGGGIVRNVDSSLDRVQVKLTGFKESRYVVDL